MKLIAYVFKEEPRFDVTDTYRVNITKERIDSLMKSKKTYEANKFEIKKIIELVEQGDIPIPGSYFDVPYPVLFIIQNNEGKVKAYSKDGLIRYMRNHNEDTIKNSNTMYITLKDDDFKVHGIQEALASSAKSDYLYIRSDEKESCRVYTGYDLNLDSGKVKIHGRSFGYVLKVNSRYEKILNAMENRGKKYVTEVIYMYLPSETITIQPSENVVKVLDEIKDEVYKKDREIFGNIYTKVKSNIPLEADFQLDNSIYGIRVVENGKSELIRIQDIKDDYYNSISGKVALIKINGNLKLVENYDKTEVKVSYKYRPSKYEEVTLKSKEGFRVVTSKYTGIKCRISGIAKVPCEYEEIGN